MFSNFKIGLSIVLGSICSCEKWYNLSKLDPPNSYNGQIGSKIAVLLPFSMIRHFFHGKIFDFFSMELKGLPMGFPPVYGFPGLFPTVLAENCLDIPRKVPKKC